ncbi:hypothetical protein JYU34_003729 [Plutella xylostella]|uniref:Uncharacterized protein n=1 Tax=Plutella xylostella TaxID=51655 RepID=A0ABQ7R0S3_PLUXY|nr:hypothetical protein JYU34_003729 [Plutella xylostella]
MVNLPTPTASESYRHNYRPRSHHLWGSRYGKDLQVARQKKEPACLIELEDLASRAASQMDKWGSSPNHKDIATRLLRQQYNMEFKIKCHKCSGTHDQDEIYAPER